MTQPLPLSAAQEADIASFAAHLTTTPTVTTEDPREPGPSAAEYRAAAAAAGLNIDEITANIRLSLARHYRQARRRRTLNAVLAVTITLTIAVLTGWRAAIDTHLGWAIFGWVLTAIFAVSAVGAVAELRKALAAK